MNTYTLTADSVAAILAELPGEWTTEQRHDHYVAATRADGLAIGFHSHTYGPSNGKVEVSLMVTHAEVRYDEHAPSINVTMTRPAKTLAGDIARRLMPDAETFHALIVERVARTNDYAAKVAANVAALVTVDGVTNYTGGRDERGNLHVRTPGNGDVWGDVTVYNDSANVTLHGLSIEAARQLLALAMGQTVR